MSSLVNLKKCSICRDNGQSKATTGIEPVERSARQLPRKSLQTARFLSWPVRATVDLLWLAARLRDIRRSA